MKRASVSTEAAMENHHAYESLAKELAGAGVLQSPAELHGGICGVMCVGGVEAADRWLDQCLDEWQPQAAGEVGEALRELEVDTWRMLSAVEMAFEPLLPDDDQPLEEQVRALASWCHGFLTGLGFGGLKEPRGSCGANEAVAEITKDFSEISRATLDDDDASDPRQAGFALAELKEYVRVSVQLVFEHFGGRQLETGSDTVH
jgi:uncharacterized protein